MKTAQHYLLLLLSATVLSVCAQEKPSDEVTPRTWIYDDTQVFFTIMVYFPFVANFFSADLPLKRSNDPLPPPESLARTEERVVIPESVQESDGASYSNASIADTAASEHRNSSMRDAETPVAGNARQKRFLFDQDEQPINVFLCVSLPFSVPILRYDDRLEKKYKDRVSRKKMADKLPQLQPQDDDFVESNHNDEDSEDFFDDEGYDGDEDGEEEFA